MGLFHSQAALCRSAKPSTVDMNAKPMEGGTTDIPDVPLFVTTDSRWVRTRPLKLTIRGKFPYHKPDEIPLPKMDHKNLKEELHSKTVSGLLLALLVSHLLRNKHCEMDATPMDIAVVARTEIDAGDGTRVCIPLWSHKDATNAVLRLDRCKHPIPYRVSRGREGCQQPALLRPALCGTAGHPGPFGVAVSSATSFCLPATALEVPTRRCSVQPPFHPPVPSVQPAEHEGSDGIGRTPLSPCPTNAVQRTFPFAQYFWGT